MRKKWLVTIDEADYIIEVRRNMFGLVKAWVNGQKVASVWRLQKKGDPIFLPLGDKAKACFSAMSDWAYAYTLKLTGEIIFPASWRSVEQGFRIPLASGARMGRLAESIGYATLIILMFFLPRTEYSPTYFLLLGIMALPILINLARFIRTLYPISVSSHGIGRDGFELVWQDITRVGLDNQGTLVIDTDYSSIIIPAWLCDDTPALARLVSDQTGLKQCRLVPVFVGFIMYSGLPIVGLGIAMISGLLLTPWWVMTAGAALGLLLGYIDVNNILVGPHRSLYTLPGIITFLVPFLLGFDGANLASIGIGLLFFVLASIWGMIVALKLFAKLKQAIHQHDMQI